MLENLLQLDGNILLWIQENVRNDILTPVMKFITTTGNAGMIWITIALILLLLPKTRKEGLLVGASLLGSLLVNNILLKNIVARVRPYEVIEGLELLVGKATDWSFPSGHTGSSFAAAVMMFLVLPRRYGILALIYALLMGFSRLYVGIHYPTDVLTGAITGTLCACIVYIIYKKKFCKEE